MKAVDQVCTALRSVAQRTGVERLELMVRADGRVTLVGLDAKGFVAWRMDMDLNPGGAYPLPSALLELP